jgi:hypothetical protein
MDQRMVACRNVLRLVQELHLRGYQKVRIAPGMAPSGVHWRCTILPASQTRADHGAKSTSGWSWPTYSSASGTAYFDWNDLWSLQPGALAELFLRRFPEVAAAGRGADWPYVGWYVEMLHLTYPDSLPYAYADWDTPLDHLPSFGGRSPRIPLPPLAPRAGAPTGP